MITRREWMAAAGTMLVSAQSQAEKAAVSVMPRGLSRARFMEAVTAYRAVVGETNVLVDEPNLVSYRKIMVPAVDANHAAAGAVLASNVDEVREVLAVSRRYRVPLWTVSTGKNFGYGTAAPATPGQMVLDLKGMDRILDFDPVLGTVLVEPGVTYAQLAQFLRDNGDRYIVTGPGAGPLVGPVGQALERGRGYTPYGDQFGNVCGMEVMLADGTLLRTGAGGVAGSRAWQCDRYGFGPVIHGLFSQSNFGVVTKLGLWLMPRPEAYRPFMVAFQGHDDLGAAVDIVQRLRLSGVVQNSTVIGNTMYVVAQMARREQVFQESGAVTDAWHTAFMRDKGGAIWGVNAALYGSEARVAADWQTVQQAFAGSGGIVLGDEQIGGDPMWQHMRGLMSGELSLQEYSIYNWRGGGGSAWFAPVMAARGQDAMKTVAMGKSIVRAYGFDYLGGYIVNARDMVQVIDVLYDRRDPKETERARRCFTELVDRYAAEGYGLYRTNIAFMGRAAAAYGPAQQDFNHRLKKALDPLGILAPGKSGIFA
jgi:4-cresol dehydrogenase (hydroxylating)